jgi:iron-sulfur cluster assembly protein
MDATHAQEVSPMISVTPVAVEKIKEAMAAEGKANMSLRIYVEGGGCSGMQYGLVFEDVQKDDDEIVPVDGFNVLIDRFSVPYLEGAEIDFVTSLKGAGFKINNPNASGSCGCGESFKP